MSRLRILESCPKLSSKIFLLNYLLGLKASKSYWKSSEKVLSVIPKYLTKPDVLSERKVSTELMRPH
jgi:hypothetical protein